MRTKGGSFSYQSKLFLKISATTSDDYENETSVRTPQKPSKPMNPYTVYYYAERVK
jgi:hypothetical protein